MSNIKFEGMYAATFSLYDQNLNVLKDSVQKLIAYNEANGLRGFYVGGNTGECLTLPNRTRKQTHMHSSRQATCVPRWRLSTT